MINSSEVYASYAGRGAFPLVHGLVRQDLTVTASSGIMRRANTIMAESGEEKVVGNRAGNYTTFLAKLTDYSATGKDPIFVSNVSNAFDMLRLGSEVSTQASPRTLYIPAYYAQDLNQAYYNASPSASADFFTKIATQALTAFSVGVDTMFLQKLLGSNMLKIDNDTLGTDGIEVDFATDTQPAYSWTLPLYSDTITGLQGETSLITSELHAIGELLSGSDRTIGHTYHLVPPTVWRELTRRLEVNYTGQRTTDRDERVANHITVGRYHYGIGSETIVKFDGLPETGNVVTGVSFTNDSIAHAFQKAPMENLQGLLLNRSGGGLKLFNEAFNSAVNQTIGAPPASMMEGLYSMVANGEVATYNDAIFKYMNSDLVQNPFLLGSNILTIASAQIASNNSLSSYGTDLSMHINYTNARIRPAKIIAVEYDLDLFGANPAPPFTSKAKDEIVARKDDKAMKKNASRVEARYEYHQGLQLRRFIKARKIGNSISSSLSKRLHDPKIIQNLDNWDGQPIEASKFVDSALGDLGISKKKGS